ncbi:prepilin-type N-terminal cleavage/methylation domain-containing protein [Patescibacteria group bacterium]|nr:prepilin-type N-terminal cleavage/methylation domain-containing protein [Patescibacteria group bacterium]
MKTKNQKGLSLIEVLFSVFILAILSIGIFSLFQIALNVLAENKARVGAVSLANEKMEIIRNLSYENVGTDGGWPSGDLEQTELITKNNIEYTVNIAINYVDDLFDGDCDTDLDCNDYKDVEIEVLWTGHLGVRNVIMRTAVAPRGLETMTGGVLRVSVFDANGDPVDNAQVHLVNNIISPTINTNFYTNDSGQVIIPDLEESLNTYQLDVTKIVVPGETEYSIDRTCAIDSNFADCTNGNADPTKPHASVIESEITEISFAIDLVSTLTIRTVNQTTPLAWIVNTGDLSEDQDNPAITVCDSGEYIFGWRDDDYGIDKIYSQRYDEYGEVIWVEDKAISTASKQNNIDLAVDNDCNIYATWQDDRDDKGNEDVYFVSYDDNGDDRWDGEKKIVTEAESSDQSWPKITLNTAKDRAYIAWEDERNDNGDIYIIKYDISSEETPLSVVAEFDPAIKVNSDSIGSAQEKPVVANDTDDNIYVVWEDDRNFNYDIYAQKLNSDGTKLWSDTKINSDSGASQENPDIALDSSDNLYVVWQDFRSDNDYDIYIQKYDSSGNRLWALEDIKVNSDSSDASQENPVIAVYDPGTPADIRIYVVWQDYRNSNSDIYMQIFDYNGNKQLDYDLNIGNGSADQENPDIIISPITGFPTITWQDNTNGDWDIIAAQYGDTIENGGNVANVAFDMSGSKTIGEDINEDPIYKYNNITLQTDGTGTLILTNMEWDTYTINLDPDRTLLMSEPPIPFLLNPNTSLTVFLNVE